MSPLDPEVLFRMSETLASLKGNCIIQSSNSTIVLIFVHTESKTLEDGQALRNWCTGRHCFNKYTNPIFIHAFLLSARVYLTFGKN